jgi:hypothetical protein
MSNDRPVVDAAGDISPPCYGLGLHFHILTGDELNLRPFPVVGPHLLGQPPLVVLPSAINRWRTTLGRSDMALERRRETKAREVRCTVMRAAAESVMAFEHR